MPEEIDPLVTYCEKCGCEDHPCLPCNEVVALNGNHTDSEYLRLVDDILRNGKRKKNRTGIDTIGIFGAQAKFDVDMNAFPILTTKKVWFKGIVHELLWFIKGDTNIKYLVRNGVGIWNEWAYKRYVDCNKINGSFEDDKWMRYFNGSERVATKDRADSCSMYPQDEFIEKIKMDDEFAARWGELGEGTYGGMWRAFPYNRFDDIPPLDTESFYPAGGGGKFNTKLGTVDQLKKVLDKLKTNPDDRRMIVSAWHPYWVDHCALPPCHVMFQFHTEELTEEERLQILCNGMSKEEVHTVLNAIPTNLDQNNIPKHRVNLMLTQRSNDFFLGIPFNITSYSLLLALVAHCVNMVPGTFTHSFGDAHIYVNHLEQINLQRTRTPKLLPKLKLTYWKKDLFDFNFDDITLEGYDPHPAIKGEVAV